MTGVSSAGRGRPGPRLPVLLALGKRREGEILSFLEREGDLAIQRCTGVRELIDLASRRDSRAAAIVFGGDLPLLSEAAYADLARTGVPLVLLTGRHEERHWEDFPGVVVPADASLEAIRAGLDAALRGERSGPPQAGAPVSRAGPAFPPTEFPAGEGDREDPAG